ncbi:universal stress protein [Pendulispora brunnea]|uniref:Universal stress protein n=1 Tax=Pendulispora brunnea TaxID=2905690 RepID=A0ABZ2JZ16_9BACT
MAGFKHVLVPIDFEETSGDVIDAAITMAGKFDAKVTLVHAFFIQPLAYANGFYVPIEDVLREARAVLDKLADDVRQRYPKVDAVLAHGEPWSEILNAAKGLNVDLIVMGTHGRRGLSRAFLGSIAERVVRLSPVPVLTVSTRTTKKDEKTRPVTAPGAT